MRKSQYIRWRIIITLFIIPCFISSCDVDLFDTRMSEGEVVYDVSYPYTESTGFMANMLPEEMVLKFKNNNMYSDLSAGMGMFRLTFITDNEKKTMAQLLKVMNKKLVSNLDEELSQEMIETFPSMTIVHTDDTDTIAGFHCKKAIAIYDHYAKPEVIIYYTDEIKLKDPNWNTQFHEIDGVLLAYEVEQFNLRMRLTAKEVRNADIENDVFIPNEDYEEVSPKQMQLEMEELLEVFNMN